MIDTKSKYSVDNRHLLLRLLGKFQSFSAARLKIPQKTNNQRTKKRRDLVCVKASKHCSWLLLLRVRYIAAVISCWIWEINIWDKTMPAI